MKPIQILLIVDKEQDVSDIKYALDKLRLYYEFSYARDAATAIEALNNKTIKNKLPDFLLVDDDLSDQSGRELIKRIREEKKWRGFSCFLMLTPEKYAILVPEDMNGISGCIHKPFSLSGLATSGSLHLAMELMNRNNSGN